MSGENQQDGFNRDRAELFEALGHPTRIKILQVLSKSQLGFSDLKKEAGMDSNGLLSFHLGKLDGLVKTTPEGSYQLTDEGKEALRMMAAKVTSNPDIKNRQFISSLKVLTVALVIALAFTIFYSYYSNQQLNSSFNKLNQSYYSLSSNYNDLNTQYYNSLSSLLIAINSGTNTTIQPPISELQALQIALEYGGWNATSLEGYQVSIGLWYALIWHENANLGSGFELIQTVNTPVSNYSATTFVYTNWPPANYTGPIWSPVYPPVTFSYHYVWVVEIEQASDGLSIPPPGLYWIDAATGEVVSPPMAELA